MQVLRRIAVGVGAGIVAGVLAGVVARLMMRLATLAAGHESGFSLSGTVGILIGFSVFVLPGSVLAAFVRRRGRSALLVLGALALAVPASSIARTDIGSVAGLTSLQWVGVGLATAGVFAAIAAMPLVALRTLAAWGAGPATSRSGHVLSSRSSSPRAAASGG